MKSLWQGLVYRRKPKAMPELDMCKNCEMCKDADILLGRCLELLENCTIAIGTNDMHAMEQAGGAARSFMDKLRAK